MALSQATGALTSITMTFEEEYNVPPAAPVTYKLPFNTFGLKGSQAKNTPATIRGSRNPYPPFAGNIDATGPVVIPMDYIAMHYWMRAMFGAPTITGTAAPFTESFKVPDSQPSFILEKSHNDISKHWRYGGCKVSKFSFNLGGDGELTASLDILAAEETIPATAISATPTAVGLGRLSNFQASIKIGGTAVGVVKTCSLSLDNDLDADMRVIGGMGKRGGLPEGIIKVEGDISMIYNDNTYVDMGAANTETSIEIDILNSTGYGIKFYLDEMEFERLTAPIDGPKGIMASGRFFGFLSDDTDQSAVRVEIITDQEN